VEHIGSIHHDFSPHIFYLQCKMGEGKEKGRILTVINGQDRLRERTWRHVQW